MKPIRTILSLSIALLMLVSSLAFGLPNLSERGKYEITNGVTPYADTIGHWSEIYVLGLTQNHLVSGYPDGTFKPEKTISIGEFLSLLVRKVSGYKVEQATTGHWASTFLTYAKENGLILASEDDFNLLNDPITRGQMCRLMARATKDIWLDKHYFIPLIADYDELDKNNRDAVLQLFRMGVMNGYPDGTFKDQKSVTRAEACTSFFKFTSISTRTLPECPSDNEQLILITEDPDPLRTDYYLIINIYKDLDTQYSQAKTYLGKWVDQNTLEEMIDYAMEKQEQLPTLELKEWASNNRHHRVISGYNQNYICIYGW